MRAAEQLAKRQREYPLGPAGDRIGELFQGLPPLIEPQFERARTSANVIAGEMNFRQPNAKAFHYPDGSHLITVYSGLVDFYTNACRILANEGTFHSNEGSSEGRSLEDFIVDLAALFRAWTPEGISENRPEELDLQTVDETRSVIAERLLAGALRFILCHELGHVVFYDPSKDESVAALTKEQEAISDVAGMRAAISCSPNLGDIRMNLAGCVISLRVLAVFQALGHPFTGDHPDPLNRVNNVFAALRPFCQSHAQYWAVSPIAYAFDELLETAGQRATGGSEVLPLRPDRSFSRMCSAMEESLKGRQPESIIVPLMTHDFTEATDEQMAEIAMFAAEMFAEDSPSRQEKGMLWAERGEFFRSIYHQWPARAVAYFDYAFAHRKQARV